MSMFILSLLPQYRFHEAVLAQPARSPRQSPQPAAAYKQPREHCAKRFLTSLVRSLGTLAA